MNKNKIMHNKLVKATEIINSILDQESDGNIILYVGCNRCLNFTDHRDFYCELENDCFVFYDRNHSKVITIVPETERIIRIYASEIYHITITDVEHEAISITL